MSPERQVLEELPAEVAGQLGALAHAIMDVEHPLDRLAVARLVRARLATVLDSVVGLGIRDAREDRYTLDDIGRALAVSPQRVSQLARLEAPDA